MSILLEIKNVWKKYGDVVVLEQLSKNVNAGEFVTIVGASGCGKTTFLNMLLGTESYSKGKILLDGKPLPDEPSQDRGVVFQRYSAFPHLTVLRNTMLGAELSASPYLGIVFSRQKFRDIKNKAEEMLESVGLSHALDSYPHELSGGMQQRLSIAQALMKQPRMLLLDEPFGALDPGTRSDMHKLILALWKETGITIFMVTHDIEEGFYLGTRLWVFDKVRFDPHDADAYGAQITYDIDVDQSAKQRLKKELELELVKSKQAFGASK